MKIILAAPIFFPDVGGPATHVQKIAEFLTQKGYTVSVISYGEDPGEKQFPFSVTRISRSQPRFIRWFRYTGAVLRATFGADLVYAFDLTAAGLPAALATRLFRKPFFIRIGGDPIWERVVEHHKRFIPLTAYYEQKLYEIDAPYLYRMIVWVVRQAESVITYNQSFQDFYCCYFGTNRSRMHIIKNPVFFREKRSNVELTDVPTILFAGRFVAYKNLKLVIRAIGEIRKVRPVKLLLVGAGPDEALLRKLVEDTALHSSVEFRPSLPQLELFKLLSTVAISIGPAISEFNPNSILESLSFGTPVLLAQDNGLSVQLPPEQLFDPMNQNDFEVKIISLLSKEGYARALEAVSKLDLNQSWDTVLNSHLKLIQNRLSQL